MVITPVAMRLFLILRDVPRNVFTCGAAMLRIRRAVRAYACGIRHASILIDGSREPRGSHPHTIDRSRMACGSHPHTIDRSRTACGSHPHTIDRSRMACGSHPHTIDRSRTACGSHPHTIDRSRTACGRHPHTIDRSRMACGSDPHAMDGSRKPRGSLLYPMSCTLRSEMRTFFFYGMSSRGIINLVLFDVRQKWRALCEIS